MAKSGNPAKQALNEAENGAVSQVRAGISQGKSAVIQLTPNTKVTINSTDVDEAEFIARIIIENLNVTDVEEVGMRLHAMQLYMMLYSQIDAKTNAMILRYLQRMVARHKTYAEYHKVPVNHG